MSARPRLIAVVGPTAVGKTALAVTLSQRFDGEIVNADSRQVYVGMDIGTAKPTASEQEAALHHLIDFRAPDESLSLGEYLPLARRCISGITAGGKLPIICGGSGQYVWALIEGWKVPRVSPDPQYRAQLEERAATEGTGELWRELNALDPDRANAVDRHNTRRVIRALEIVHTLGRATPARERSPEPPYGALILGLTADRKTLYDRIDARFDRMMADGLLQEARRLAAEGYSLGQGPLSGVGYSQLGDYFAGKMTLEVAIQRAKTQTHRLVRRQYTWFKTGDERIKWLDATHELPVAEACEQIGDFLAR